MENEPIKFPTWRDKRAALADFDAQIRAAKARRESVSREELDAALSTVTDSLRINWSTGGGRRLRQFVWSLWNGWTWSISSIFLSASIAP